uniref:RNA helicase n=1 Tax=Lygus hesperus TaxID=30085 RepID=A0A0A9XJQ0_LYGHE
MLNYIGALDDDGELTEIGKIISTFPVEPEQAKILLESPKYSCSNEILTVVAMLNTPQVFINGPSDQSSIVNECHKKFASKDSDHITLLNIYQEYKQNLESQEWCWKNYLNHRSLKSADNIRSQLIRMMERYNLTINSTPTDSIEYNRNIRKALLEGFFMQVAHLQRNGMYLTVKDQQIVRLHPSTCVVERSEWVLYHEFVLTTEQFIRTVTAIQGEWLIAIAPHYYDLSNFPPGTTRIQIEKLYEERQRILAGLQPSRI